MWRNDVVVALPVLDSGASIFGAAVNASGVVVGSYGVGGAEQRAVVWGQGGAQDLGTFGGAWAHARAVNDRNEVLVVMSSETGGGGLTSFVWRDGDARPLGHLGGGETEGFAIGTGGHVVGRSRTAAGALHAFVWHEGIISALAPLTNEEGSSSVAVVVNAAGTSAGQHVSATGTIRGVRWAAGVPEDLGIDDAQQMSIVAINDVDQILVSVTTTAGISLGYLWSDGVAQVITGSGGGAVVVSGLSATGSVAGWEVLADETDQAFRWRDGTFEGLGTLGGRSSRALAISAEGVIVGESNVPEGDLRGFVWDGTMRLLPNRGTM